MNFVMKIRANSQKEPKIKSALKTPCALLLISLTIVSTLGTQSAESTVVIPRGFETTTGFGFQRIFENQQRHTYVFDPSELLSAMPQGGLITAIAFRPDETMQGSLTVTVPDIEFRMSTSPNPVSFPPDRFEYFVGSDVTTVFPRGPLQLDASNVPNARDSFSYVIPLPRVFSYDPKNGPLTLDIFTYLGSATAAPIDFAGASGKTLGGGINASDPVAFSGGVAAIQLTFLPIPEPGVISITLLGFLVFIIRKVRKI